VSCTSTPTEDPDVFWKVAPSVRKMFPPVNVKGLTAEIVNPVDQPPPPNVNIEATELVKSKPSLLPLIAKVPPLPVLDIWP
jgi:hypothetical protein